MSKPLKEPIRDIRKPLKTPKPQVGPYKGGATIKQTKPKKQKGNY